MLFTTVYRVEYRKMINKIDLVVKLPNHKSIKKDITSAYQKSVKEIKELLYTTCKIALITI